MALIHCLTMDAKSRYSNYIKWKNDEIKVIVATSAFGMGINKEDIRHIVRYGVPESLTSWAQELGRACRDGHPATATIYYSMDNTNHAMAWIRDHVSNANYCKQLLGGIFKLLEVCNGRSCRKMSAQNISRCSWEGVHTGL